MEEFGGEFLCEEKLLREVIDSEALWVCGLRMNGMVVGMGNMGVGWIVHVVGDDDDDDDDVVVVDDDCKDLRVAAIRRLCWMGDDVG